MTKAKWIGAIKPSDMQNIRHKVSSARIEKPRQDIHRIQEERPSVVQVLLNGGLLGRQIEGVARDDKFSGAGAVAATRELAGMGINLFIGGASSVAALGVLPLLPELKAVLSIVGSAAMSVTHEAFSRNAFRVLANANMQYGGLGRALAQQYPNVMKWQAIRGLLLVVAVGLGQILTRNGGRYRLFSAYSAHSITVAT